MKVQSIGAAIMERTLSRRIRNTSKMHLASGAFASVSLSNICRQKEKQNKDISIVWHRRLFIRNNRHLVRFGILLPELRVHSVFGCIDFDGI